MRRRICFCGGGTNAGVDEPRRVESRRDSHHHHQQQQHHYHHQHHPYQQRHHQHHHQQQQQQQQQQPRPLAAPVVSPENIYPDLHQRHHQHVIIPDRVLFTSRSPYQRNGNRNRLNPSCQYRAVEGVYDDHSSSYSRHMNPHPHPDLHPHPHHNPYTLVAPASSRECGGSRRRFTGIDDDDDRPSRALKGKRPSRQERRKPSTSPRAPTSEGLDWSPSALCAGPRPADDPPDSPR